MRVLIVHAHHEPSSFNTALLTTARETLAAAGHGVRVSDLYAMGFQPVSDRRNFRTVADARRLDQQAEERLAAATGGFADDIAAEIEKLLWCDHLIFQFPIWWLGLPAILKGWVDRVFALGVAYGGGRWFDGGALAGRRAMLSVTVGGTADVYSDIGVYGPLEDILFPIHRGIFGFTGFQVIEPFAVYGPGRMDATARAGVLAAYRETLLTLDRAAVLPMPKVADYERLVLKPGLRPVAP